MHNQQPEHSKPVRLAAAAYHAALAGEWEKATRAVQRIGDECGSEGIQTALLAWCDTYVDHATDGEFGPVRPRMAYVNARTGELDDEQSKRLPDQIRWAGQLIAARAAMDEPKYLSLLDALPDHPRDIGEYVGAVLHTIATTVNGWTRGFAQLGRDASA